MEIFFDIERSGAFGEGKVSYHFAREEVLLGRSENADLRLIDPAVSLIHARVLWEGNHWAVTDVGSANGTILDGRRLEPGKFAVLRLGARLRVGPFVLRVVAPEEASEEVVAGIAPQNTVELARALVRETFVSVDDSLPELEVLSEPLLGDRLPLELEENTIGRGPECTFALPDADASRLHACFRRDAVGGIEVIDLGSKNGVWVGGERITAARRLLHGDEIELGRTRLRFHDPAEAALRAIRSLRGNLAEEDEESEEFEEREGGGDEAVAPVAGQGVASGVSEEDSHAPSISLESGDGAREIAVAGEASRVDEGASTERSVLAGVKISPGEKGTDASMAKDGSVSGTLSKDVAPGLRPGSGIVGPGLVSRGEMAPSARYAGRQTRFELFVLLFGGGILVAAAAAAIWFLAS